MPGCQPAPVAQLRDLDPTRGAFHQSELDELVRRQLQVVRVVVASPEAVDQVDEQPPFAFAHCESSRDHRISLPNCVSRLSPGCGRCVRDVDGHARGELVRRHPYPRCDSPGRADPRRDRYRYTW